jgi:hypothetical protein
MMLYKKRLFFFIFWYCIFHGLHDTLVRMLQSQVGGNKGNFLGTCTPGPESPVVNFFLLHSRVVKF